MKEANPDFGKSVVVDVESDSKEINETFDSLRQEYLLLRKRMFLWKTDVYRDNPEMNKPKVKTYLSLGEGTQKPDEINSLLV